MSLDTVSGPMQQLDMETRWAKSAGVGPARLGVLRAIQSVSRAMATYGIGKNDKNASQGFNFRGIDSVLDALATPLVDAGLIVLPQVVDRVATERPTKAGGVQYHVALTVHFRLTAVEDGSTEYVTFQGEASDAGDKATSKALSMAYKYFAFQTFCIPVKGLDDADHETPAPSAPKASKPATKPQSDAPAQPLPENDTEIGALSEADVVLAEIRGAKTSAELAALKVRVSSFRKAPQWEAIKALYTARNTELKGA